MVKDEDIKEPTYGNLEGWEVRMGKILECQAEEIKKWPSERRPGEWIEVEDVPHPPQWLWKLGLWGVFIVGLLLGVVLAG